AAFAARQTLLNQTSERERKLRIATIEELNTLIKGAETKAARERFTALQDDYNKQIELINDARNDRDHRNQKRNRRE
ncbi:MAG TPA: hypothetical protein PKE69_21010, partial [Pyrinomonadaceae bacterium]|nr:hypothetical protein [Pyrinomonadaceae bacterium]